MLKHTRHYTTHPKHKLLIASPGTGKSTKITSQVTTLINNGTPSDQILILTSTESNAEWLRNVIEMNTAYGAAPSVWSVKHLSIFMLNNLGGGVKVQLNAEKVFRDGLVKASPLEVNWLELRYFEVLEQFGVREGEYVGFVEGFVDDGSVHRKKYYELHGLLAKKYRWYEEMKIKRNVLNMSDVMFQLDDALKSDGGVEYLRDLYQYVFVDNIQDFTDGEYLFLLAILRATNAESLIAGDDNCSIFRWKGGLGEAVFHRLRQDIPNIQLDTLNHNYRCASSIQKVARKFIQSNKQKLESLLPKLKYIPPSEDTPVGFIQYLDFDSYQDQYYGILDLIPKLNGSICVLVPSQSLFREVYDIFQSNSISVSVKSSQSVFSMEQRYLFSLLKFFASGVSNFDFFNVLVEIYQFPQKYIQRLELRSQSGMSLVESLQDFSIQNPENEEIRNAMEISKRIVRDYTFYSEMTDRGLVIVLSEILSNNQYFNKFLKPQNLEEKKISKKIIQFVETMRKLEETPSNRDIDKSLLIDQIEAKFNESSFEDIEKVRVMTPWQLGNEEFDYIFFTSFFDSIYPGTFKKRQQVPKELLARRGLLPETHKTHKEEKRRILYTSLMKAKTGFYFCWSSDKPVSRFLTELTSKEGQKKVKVEQKNEIKAPPVTFIDLSDFDHPKSISIDEILRFRECPAQYAYSVINAIDEDLFQNAFIDTVQEFHRMMKEDRLNMEYQMLDFMLLEFDKFHGYENQTPNSKQLIRNRAFDMLLTIMDMYNEYEICKFDSPFSLNIEGYQISGNFDAIYDDGRQTIISKVLYTDKKNPNDHHHLFQFQSSLYSWVWKEMNNHSATCNTHVITKKSLLTFSSNPNQKEDIRSFLSGMVNTIRNAKYYPQPEKKKCASCVFKDICMFKN